MAVQDKFVLAIDLGTSGPKVALFSTQGELVDNDFEPTGLQLLPDGGAEQSPDEWWQAIRKAVKRMLSRRTVLSEEIVAVTTTGQWSGTVAVDEAGQALGNAIVWMDTRGASHLRRVAGGFPELSGYSLPKLVRWLDRTAGVPGIAGKDPTAHILFLKYVRPDIYRQTYRFLEPIDYIGLRLTGCMAASYASIALYWLTDNRRIAQVQYDQELTRICGIDAGKLPELKPVDAVLGTLLPEVAREWGLRSDVKVMMGSPDTHSAAVGSGGAGDYEFHIYVGTSAWVVCHVPWKATDLIRNQCSIPSAIPGHYLIINEQECAGACLQFLRDSVVFAQDGLSSGAAPSNAYELFDQVAATAPAGSGKTLFTPWLYGERGPMEDPHARAGFFNQSLRTTRAEIVRAVYEGVAYNARWPFTNMEQFTRRRTEAVRMVGGGAKSAVWCQIFADVLDRTVHQMKEPVQANLRGASLLASTALGYLSYEDIPSRVPVARTFSPDPANREIYDELFREFVELYRNNRKAFARLNRPA